MNKKITAPRIFVGVLVLFMVALIGVMLILPSFGYFKAVFDRMGVTSLGPAGRPLSICPASTRFAAVA